MLNLLFKSLIDQDQAAVVICDLDSVIVYMNPAAVGRYHQDLTGRSLKACHNDVYMVALRDDDRKLIGYYEKHEYRNRETVKPYQF